MFDRFTTQAKTALVLSQTEAQNAGAGEIGPVHLALGCFSQPRSDAVRLIETLNLSAELIANVIRPSAVGQPSDDRLLMNGELKRVLMASMRLAMEAGHTMVTSAHLLASIVSVDPAGEVAARVTESYAGQIGSFVASLTPGEVMAGGETSISSEVDRKPSELEPGP